MTMNEAIERANRDQIFEQFVGWAKNEIKNYLPNEFCDAKVEVSTADSTGGELNYTGLHVRKPNQMVVPIINLDECFEDYVSGSSMHNVMEGMVTAIVQNTPMINTEVMHDYEKAKEHLFVKVGNYEKNKDLLQNVPFEKIGDLAITVHVMFKDRGRLQGSATVTNKVLNYYGVPEGTLFNDAFENSQKKLPVMIDNIMNILMAFGAEVQVSEDKNPPAMLIVTNNIGAHGASAIFYPGVMEQIAERLGGNFIVLPSSIHETIVVPETEEVSFANLENMVRKINGDTLLPEEFLSDHIYRYDAESKTFDLVRA